MTPQTVGIEISESAKSANWPGPPSIASYWQEQYRNEPYYSSDFTFSDYLPAYMLGTENYNSSIPFESVEDQLSQRWFESKGKSRLRWTQARNAVRAGWYHIKRVRKDYGPTGATILRLS